MMDESALALRAGQGDASAFEELFHKYKTFVWNVAYRMTYNFDMAEDLAQDVFISAWKSLPAFRGASAFSTWIYRITVNTTLNMLRRRPYEQIASDEQLHGVLDTETFMRQNPETRTQTVEAERELSALLARLSPERRLALVLKEIEGLSYEQIAQATGVPLGTVRSRIARARADLGKIAESEEKKNETRQAL